MVSAIDPSKPVDGTPASKADLRANLLAAKNEIESLQALVAGTEGGFINAKDYGATGDGTTDDLATLEAAFAAAQTAKKGLFLPPGVYRITDTWNLGGPTYLDINELAITEAEITGGAKYLEIWACPSYNASNRAANHGAKHPVEVRGAGCPHTTIWGDFANPPSGVKAIVADWQAMYDSNPITGRRLVCGDFAIAGNDDRYNGSAWTIIGSGNTPANTQVGLFAPITMTNWQNLSVQNLYAGILSSDCYYTNYRNLYSQNCTYAFTFWQTNAMSLTSLHGLTNRDNTRFLAFWGNGSSVRDLSVQGYDTDLWLLQGSANKVSGCYFETNRPTAGYSIRCGISTGGAQVIDCLFDSINNPRVSEKNYRFRSTFDCAIIASRILASGAANVLFEDTSSFVRGFSWDWTDANVTPAAGKTVADQVSSWGRNVGATI